MNYKELQGLMYEIGMEISIREGEINLRV